MSEQLGYWPADTSFKHFRIIPNMEDEDNQRIENDIHNNTENHTDHRCAG
ncbi:hypothetical protein NST74_29305 [Paenibacillus sp. FSL F4-0125]